MFSYYENLEKNLQQVRNEIDKLKQEAVEDLAYLTEILNDQDLVDYDQVYLKAEEEDEEEVCELNKEEEEMMEEEEEEEEETQYLSQPASGATTLNQANDSSQVYLTPAESWHTLQNINKDLDNDKTIQQNNENINIQNLQVE